MASLHFSGTYSWPVCGSWPSTRAPSEGVRAEAAPGDHGGERQQDAVDRHHLELLAAAVRESRDGHQGDDSGGGPPGPRDLRDTRQRREDEPERGEDFESTDELDWPGPEILGPAQSRGGQLLRTRLNFIAPASRNTAASTPAANHKRMFIDPRHSIQ